MSADSESEGFEMRLIIACDQPPAVRRLSGELSNCPAEITCVTSLVELKVACESRFELALINVAPAELVEFIGTIRRSPSGIRCAIVVASERLLNETGLAGVLPKLRAVPCLPGDLVKLARWLITGNREEARKRNVRPPRRDADEGRIQLNSLTRMSSNCA